MRRIRILTCPVIFAAVLATSPPPAAGQTREGDPLLNQGVTNIYIQCPGCRPGTEIESARLGEFLADNLTLDLSGKAYSGRRLTPGKTPAYSWSIEFISREGGIVGEHGSGAEFVTDIPGVTHFIAKREIPIPRGFSGQWERLVVAGFGSFDTIEEVWTDRRCADATHAVRIALASDDEQAEGPGPRLMCLTIKD
jgi:hypothetical protein